MERKINFRFSRSWINPLCALCLCLMLAPPGFVTRLTKNFAIFQRRLSFNMLAEYFEGNNELGDYFDQRGYKINYQTPKWKDE
jgi:hypothetical protein